MNIAVPIIMALVFIFAIVILVVRIKNLKSDLATEKNINENLSRIVERQKKELEIKDKNRRDADEKINNLHDGDAVDNAVDILRH